MSEVPELTLRQIFESKIFKDGARTAMWITPFLASGVLWLLADIRSSTVDAVAEIRSQVATVVETQTDRAEDQERFQAGMMEFKTATLAASREAELRDVEFGKDMARIKGILEAMESRRVSATFGAPWPMSTPLVATDN